jgi:pimeloyl-ACP methyl ester carboxylesterase
MPMTSGYAPVQGGRLYYEVAGTGAPVVLIHAGLWDSRIWDAQWDAFARRHTVIRYDLRGFGRSDRFERPFSARGDLAALLEHLHVPSAALIGASIGGALAIDFALERPGMVDALVLVASGLSGDETPDDEETLRLVGEAQQAFEAGDLERTVDAELRIWAPLRTEPDVEHRIREIAQDNRHELTLDWKLSAELDPPAAERLGQIGVPTLVVLGERDAAVMNVIGDKLANGIRGARKQVIAGADHLPNMRRPEEFNRIVLDFLESL